MKLKDLFCVVPVHAYTVLDIQNMDGEKKHTICANRWVDDDGMPHEYDAYASCEVSDLRGDDEIAGLLRICVTSRDTLVMKHESAWDNWKYTAEDGTVYDIAELVRPRMEDGCATYDIGVLMHLDDDGNVDILDYVWGIGTIEHDELLRFCRDAVARHKKSLGGGSKN